MGRENADGQSRMRLDSLRLIGYALLAGFLLPVIISGFGRTRIIFLNFSLLGKGSVYQTLMLLHPLLAGVGALWIGKSLKQMPRAISLLSLSLFPIFLILGDDFLSGNLRGLNFQTFPSILLVLSIIGLAVGSGHFSKTGHATGNWISVISAAVFLLVSVIPVIGTKPIFFSFFDLLKMRRISSGFFFLGLTLIGTFLCNMYAALTAFINLTNPPNAEKNSARSARLILFSSLATPLVLFLVSISGEGLFMVLFGFLKFTLWIGGVFGLIGWSWLDLLDYLEPVVQTGAQLFSEREKVSRPADRPPPNIWDGPPPPD